MNKRVYPRGLCETCVFRYRCDYAKRNANESVLACADNNALSYMKDPDAKPEAIGFVRACIIRDKGGEFAVMVQRDKRKWWFRLGYHAETDASFRRALKFGNVHWEPKIQDRTKLF